MFKNIVLKNRVKQTAMQDLAAQQSRRKLLSHGVSII